MYPQKILCLLCNTVRALAAGKNLYDSHLETPEMRQDVMKFFEKMVIKIKFNLPFGN